MTFSISARCARAGMVGTAVSSSSMAVTARCSYIRAGVGAVSTQNITDPTLGPKGLDLMAAGMNATDALARLVAEGEHITYRQVAVIDANGGTATYSGERTLGVHGAAEGKCAVAAGNLLADVRVPTAMIEAFAKAPADLHLGERLMQAMEAGLTAGGEAGPVRSAGMLIAHEQAWPLADLRVDWCEEDPIAALRALWENWAPQMDDYVTRAINPASAPAYGVPGDA